MQRRRKAVVGIVALCGALTALATSEPTLRGTEPPYPSECVEQYRAALAAQGSSLLNGPPDDPTARLLYDRLTYQISGRDYVVFGMLRYTEPGRVPERYRFPEQPVLDGPDPMTTIGLSVLWEVDCLPPDVIDELLGHALDAPPKSGVRRMLRSQFGPTPVR